MRIGALFLIFLTSLQSSWAEGDSTKSLTYSLFADVYFGYDIDLPNNHLRPNFVYNHKKTNELNANLVLGQVHYQDSNSRANLGLMAGNYAQFNLSHEAIWTQFVYQANIGVLLSKKKNIWLDAGIFPSHLGFESAISSQCWTLTRTLAAENSPYYETGLRLGSINSKKGISMAFLVLNGWQNVQRVFGKQLPAIGMQFQKQFSKELLFNYGNYLGLVGADDKNIMRFFNNFYLTYENDKSFSFITGFDIGFQGQNAPYNYWYAPVLILKKNLAKHSALAIRAEYYLDPFETIVRNPFGSEFEVLGASINYDYQINSKVQWRIEAKMYASPNSTFSARGNDNFCITSNLTFQLK